MNPSIERKLEGLIERYEEVQALWANDISDRISFVHYQNTLS